MAGLSDTLARLAQAQRAATMGAASMGYGDQTAADNGRLQALKDFGANPGALRALSFVPEAAAGTRMPLVVVLHGCTQTAAGYDRGSGWSELAEDQGFAVLYPEQQRGNNGNLCFNWFAAEDIRRGGGEAQSIRSMIATMVRDCPIDPDRIYVTGLSAGGAMASVMLATYPELFAAGAIIAGLPYGTATSMSQALDRMRGRGLPDSAALAALVDGASPATMRIPRISVWHGDGDGTVAAANADAAVAQWRGVHGVAQAPDEVEQTADHIHRRWRDAQGQVVVEEYRIRGLGHGTPLATTGTDGLGEAGPHMLEAGISATRHNAAFFGIAGQPAARPTNARPAPATATASARAGGPVRSPLASRSGGSQIGDMIDGALRAAGLLR